MRTDSTNLSSDAIESCRALIEQDAGLETLPASAREYTTKKKNAQEAHEAIRPSDVAIKATQLNNMERDAERLYELIWRQFVACQMPNADYLSTLVTVHRGEVELRVRGRILRFDGYTRVQAAAGKKDDEPGLPEFKVGQELRLLNLDPVQHFTKPTARFGEASLVRELEKRGIGRPSTYASIITTIQDRGYVDVENRRFFVKKIGLIVADRLLESFSDIMDYSFTANLEASLDQVSSGDQNWKETLNDFYSDFSEKLEKASDQDDGMRSNQPSVIGKPCPQCERPMNVRTASTGVFLGCSGYDLPPKERCKQTINLIPGDEVVSATGDDEEESRILLKKRRCQECQTAMTEYLIDETRKLHVCGNNPDCIGHEIEVGQYVIKGYEGPIIDCDKCHSEMQLKTGRFGKYFGCTGETSPGEPCKNTRKLLRNGEAAPPKVDPISMPELRCVKVEDHYVLRDGASGIFLAASQFPRHRETRAPTVNELLPYKSQIDPKYQFLLKAPASDPDGNETVIRYSRKTKEQYVRSRN